MSLKELISTTIKERRQELGLTMEELAILIYDNPKMKTQVYNFESGNRTPSIETLEKFSKALNFEICIKHFTSTIYYYIIML